MAMVVGGHDGVEPAALFGVRLRRLRSSLGLTQEQLALLTGINPSNLGKIERGTANPSLATMTRIAVALGVDLGTLLSGVPPLPEPDAAD
ncbi:helix-turn-helix domain-containing protein [Gryllotalpicola ginsengisoli]|uniref:helix-turn-helix domain-containing protein n=1 Tax=Gryllotalpicola ginsengisoli TaxID=444608 RepID=UPI000686F9B2|nr:helix-turn-helix transcriptional regulator [Gryllotalpicola ginsengisoli]